MSERKSDRDIKIAKPQQLKTAQQKPGLPGVASSAGSAARAAAQVLASFSRRKGRRIAIVAFAATLLGTTGCGSSSDSDRVPVFPARGQVNIEGQKPSGAFIVLHPKAVTAQRDDVEVVRPHGIVRDDGTFELTSYETNDGAPAGEYKVTLQLRKVVTYPNGATGPGPNLVPKQYTNPEMSPLVVQVVAGSNELPPIVLKSTSPQKQAAVAHKSSQVARGL